MSRTRQAGTETGVRMTLREHTSSITEKMDEALLNSSFLSRSQKGFQMADVAVDSTIAHETEEMHSPRRTLRRGRGWTLERW